jgi:hypothetical protein
MVTTRGLGVSQERLALPIELSWEHQSLLELVSLALWRPRFCPFGGETGFSPFQLVPAGGKDVELPHLTKSIPCPFESTKDAAPGYSLIHKINSSKYRSVLVFVPADS